MRKQLVLFFLGAFCAANAQDPHFNNVNQSLVYLNPSYAGSEKCIRNQTNYRNQWPGLSGTYVTYGTCFDGHIKSINAGIALRVNSEDQGYGTLRRTGMTLSYAQYIKVADDITVIPSIQGSYNQSTLDKGRLNFNDVIDSRYGIVWNTADIPRSSIQYSDLGAGIMIKYVHNFEVGISLSNLLTPNIAHVGAYHLPISTNLYGLNRFQINRDSYVDASFIATFQNSYYNARGNVIVRGWRGVTYGLGYGESNNFYVLTGATNVFQKNVKMYLGYSSQRVRLIYSYDQNMNRSSGNTAGSHEISLSILFRKKKTGRK